MPLSDRTKFSSSGKFDLEKLNEPVRKVILFIQQNLLQFAAEFKNTTIENENGLTQELCDILNENAADSLFWFDKETMEDTASGHSPRIDLSAKTRKSIIINALPIRERKSFFKLEAKRLPTGTGNRKKEYVTKEKGYGGIDRFKEGIHSKDLPMAGMIGFVQKHAFNYWLEAINSWILELCDLSDFWTNEDLLKPQKSSFVDPSITNYQSTHSRRNCSLSPRITLHHFWIKLK